MWILSRIPSDRRKMIMNVEIRKKKQASVDTGLCVACGCCVKVCPVDAIEIYRGTAAAVRADKCVGCGRCAAECPASVITVREVAA